MDSSDVEVQKEEWSRTNGWSLPPHHLQIIAWCTIIVFGVIHFVIIVPVLHKSLQTPAYIIPAVVIVGHLICHIVTCSIDPAVDSVRINKYPKKRFDSTKHQHAIESNYCNICQVEVHPHSKHCRHCNKCIYEFDHHCVWLNNCIGSRNYRWFLCTLTTAIINFTLLVLMSFVEFVAYYTDKTNRQILQTYRDLNSSVNYAEADFMIFYQPVTHEAWLVLLGLYCIIGVVCIGLLMYLFVFHMYLLHKNLTTFNYNHNDVNDDQDDHNIINRFCRATNKSFKRNCVSPAIQENSERNIIMSSLKPQLSVVTTDYQKYYKRAEARLQACDNAQSNTTLPSTSKQENDINNNMNCVATMFNMDLNENKTFPFSLHKLSIHSTVNDDQKHCDDVATVEPSYCSTPPNVIHFTVQPLNMNSTMADEESMEKKDNATELISKTTTNTMVTVPASRVHHTY